MKKKIIIIITALLISIGVTSYFVLNNNSTSNVEETSKTKEISLKDEVDWSNYKTYNISLSNDDITITEEGVYYLTGSLDDNSISINTDGNVKLVLNNVILKNSKGPAINVENSKNTYFELIGENTIEATVNDDLDAAIYSCDDLFFEGDGTLNIKSNMDAIKSKDDLTIYSGLFNIEATDDGIVGKDSVNIIYGTFNITTTGDSIKTTNEKEYGVITIKDGEFNITTKSDAISSINSINIDGGTFNIKTGSGYSSTTKQDNKSTSDESLKGIKAEGDIIIKGGKFIIDSSDDAIHSNKNVYINGGEFDIKATDDGIHADGYIEMNKGTLNIKASEGIEGTYIKINDGTVNIEATDDGINAGNKSSDYNVTVEINGGDIKIKMGQGDTDGIDSNGNLYINGGTINITCNSPFDYDGEAKYKSGTMIINGQETTTITNQMMGGPGNGGMEPHNKTVPSGDERQNDGFERKERGGVRP